ncbi:MAG: hypothetical protein HYX49_14015 [Chloroflexi bacterium]|nr:hypothetical protein [Chloroflexota bacterium]
MQSLSRGWSFLQEAWRMAFKDKDLIKPSIYSLFAGLIVSIIGIIPIIAVVILFSDSQIGNIIIFALSAILIFVNYIVSYIFSAMTVYLIFGYLSEGDGRMDKAWAVVQRDFFDIAALAAASTAVNLLTSQLRGGRNRRGGNLIGGMLAGLIDTVWTEAAFLLLPVMTIEDVSIGNALKRVGQITKNNLLLIGVSTVGVKWVTGLIGFALAVIGAVVGFAVGGGLVFALGSSTIVYVIGLALGLLIFFAFAMAASVINTYTSTAYHTCLYLWAREAEKAQAAGQPMRVAAPAPLAAVLG